MTQQRQGLCTTLIVFLAFSCVLAKEAKESNLLKLFRYLKSQPEPDLLLYNRMPKCGSTTIDSIIRHNPNEMLLSVGHDYWGVMDANQTKMARFLAKVRRFHRSRRLSFIAGHFHYVDFRPYMFGAHLIEHINVIRDCESRYKSEVFYMLQDSVAAMAAKKDGTYNIYLAERLGGPNISIHDCMVNDACITRLVKNSLRPNATLRFFCGKQCEERYHGDLYSAAVAHLTPFSIDGGYTAVGLTERMQETLRIFECFYPTYFHSAVRHYKSRSVVRNAGHYQPTSRTFDTLIHDLCYVQGKDGIFYAEAQQHFDSVLRLVREYPEVCRHRRHEVHTTPQVRSSPWWIL